MRFQVGGDIFGREGLQIDAFEMCVPRLFISEESMFGDRLMNTELTSGDHFAEVNPTDPLYRDLQLRGYNRRFVGTPDSVFVVDDTDQVVNAVDAVVASGKKLAVRSGGHCTEGLVDDPAVRVIRLCNYFIDS